MAEVNRLRRKTSTEDEEKRIQRFGQEALNEEENYKTWENNIKQISKKRAEVQTRFICLQTEPVTDSCKDDNKKLVKKTRILATRSIITS